MGQNRGKAIYRTHHEHPASSHIQCPSKFDDTPSGADRMLPKQMCHTYGCNEHIGRSDQFRDRDDGYEDKEFAGYSQEGGQAFGDAHEAVLGKY